MQQKKRNKGEMYIQKATCIITIKYPIINCLPSEESKFYEGKGFWVNLFVLFTAASPALTTEPGTE